MVTETLLFDAAGVEVIVLQRSGDLVVTETRGGDAGGDMGQRFNGAVT